MLPLADKIDVNDLIIYAVVVAFGIVASLLKKSAKKGTPPGQAAPEEPGAGYPPPALPLEQPPAAPTPPAPRPPRVHMVRRPMARRQAVPVPPEVEPASWGVTEEVRRQQERLELGQAQRDQRLTTAAPSEADTAGIEARLLHVRPAAAAATGAKAGVLGELAGPEALRRAILHYEILSPPKALRPGPEPWEL